MDTQNQFNNLPPPPKGQSGMTLDQFKHLPPPPKGQSGMTLDQIKSSSDKQQATEQKNAFKPWWADPIGTVKAGFNDLVKPLIKDTARLGTNVLNAGQTAIGHKTTQPFSGGFLGDVTPVGADQNKSFGQNLGDAAKTGLDIGLTVGAPGEAKIADETIAGLGEKFATRAETKVGNAERANVQEMISPKNTAKEARLAQQEGRLVKGKQPTIFRSGTADTVMPSQKTLSARDTILKNIPGAGKMNPTDLYKAVDENITKMATDLRPQMEATQIKPETIQKINDDWNALKKSQMESAPATEEANVLKRQAKFEATLQKSGASHQGDLWDTRVEYDKSISKNVKQANVNSPESLQIQKEEWLQNRKILNDAINDATHGMGESSKKAFEEMSNLYEARSNILSKAKVETGIKPSKISQAYNSPTGKVIRGIVKGGAVLEGGKKIITGDF